MSRKNVFLYDIDVPEVVQKKADAAFSMIRTERENTMKEEKKSYRTRRMAGILTGAAACAAVMVLAGYFVWNQRAVDIARNEPEGIPVDEEKEENDLLSAIDNMFTLQVRAAELEEGQPVPLVDNAQLSGNDSQISGDQANSWVLGGTEDGGVYYCIQFPLSCTGNNIEKITYSINNGAFQIVQPEGESIIIDGKLYDGELNAGQIGGGWDDESGLPLRDWEILFYQSFTVDYQRQTDEYTWINICNELSGEREVHQMIWGEGNSLEEMNQGMQRLFDNTVITCTVYYTDGTSQSADVLVNSKVMACAEAGAEVEEDPDREEIFITFELQ